MSIRDPKQYTVQDMLMLMLLDGWSWYYPPHTVGRHEDFVDLTKDGYKYTILPDQINMAIILHIHRKYGEHVNYTRFQETE